MMNRLQRVALVELAIKKHLANNNHVTKVKAMLSKLTPAEKAAHHQKAIAALHGPLEQSSPAPNSAAGSLAAPQLVPSIAADAQRL